jgi:uroporphyrinogen decarboxylase
MRAITGLPNDVTPVWYLRQAGRCLPEYERLRARHGTLGIATNPELSASMTLAPVRRFGVDAAVMSADALLPLQDMGFRIAVSETHGPLVENPMQIAGIDALHVPEPEELTPYVFDAIRIVRAELPREIPLIGFIGLPYTLAAYTVTGRPARDFKDQIRAKTLMFSEPAAWHRLMDRITTMLENYVVAHARARVPVLLAFDSWVGALQPGDYDQYVLPYATRVFDRIRACGIWSINFSTGTGALLERFVQAGPDVISLDWRVLPDEAWTRMNYAKPIQGNLDPERLLASWEATKAGTTDILRRVAARPGYIFNLGHGIIRETDPDLLTRLTDFVHAYDVRRSA